MNSIGEYSYAHNSSYQKRCIEFAKRIIQEEIMENLDARQLASSTHFSIADLGCSIGPNTFYAVDSIIEALEHKFQAGDPTSHKLEFQVFFNDKVINDFNTLFTSLPPHRQYYAAGVPGSFHSRLFPKASLHFIYSSSALHWLSKVPKEVLNEGSTAWNKGRILYGSKEVKAAYLGQYLKDVESFLSARPEELVPRGLMALLVPIVLSGANPSKYKIVALLHLLGSTLIDMAKTQLVAEAKVDSFNLPFYFAHPEELEAAIQGNGSFTILKKEQHSGQEIQVATFRSALESMLTECFGKDVMDELFDRFSKKIVETRILKDESYMPGTTLVVILRRKSED